MVNPAEFACTLHVIQDRAVQFVGHTRHAMLHYFRKPAAPAAFLTLGDA
jgi:hypothetical protein